MNPFVLSTASMRVLRALPLLCASADYRRPAMPYITYHFQSVVQALKQLTVGQSGTTTTVYAKHDVDGLVSAGANGLYASHHPPIACPLQHH